MRENHALGCCIDGYGLWNTWQLSQSSWNLYCVQAASGHQEGWSVYSQEQMHGHHAWLFSKLVIRVTNGDSP